MRTGATRLGLDGGAAGTVSAEHAARPEELERRRANQRSRKEAAARAAEETARQAAEAAARAVEAAKPIRIGLAELKAAAQARRQTMDNVNA
jgi:sRNA-binding protein